MTSGLTWQMPSPINFLSSSHTTTSTRQKTWTCPGSVHTHFMPGPAAWLEALNKYPQSTYLVSGTVLSILHTLTHLILVIALYIPLLYPFYKCGSWGTEKISKLPGVTKPVSSRRQVVQHPQFLNQSACRVYLAFKAPWPHPLPSQSQHVLLVLNQVTRRNYCNFWVFLSKNIPLSSN